MTLKRRTLLKLVHWTMAPLFVWFMLVQPKDVVPLGPAYFQFHSILGLIFVILALVWTGDFVVRGLASKPGPKLPPWARKTHQIMHKTLIWGMFLVALTGFLLGLTSSRLLFAGGFLPIAPPLGMSVANDWIGIFHTIEFYALGIFALGHAGFHIWRHLKLKDNALRIMVPKLFHRYL